MIAVRHGRQVLTYAELESAANRLAHHLRALGVGPDVPVGIGLERSADWVVAALAVWKAGSAYLPLDPRYPVERLALVLRDARAPILITRSGLPTGCRFRGWHALSLRRAWMAPSSPRPSQTQGVPPIAGPIVVRLDADADADVLLTSPTRIRLLRSRRTILLMLFTHPVPLARRTA